MGLFSGDITKAAQEAKPLLDNAETRIRQVAYETVERLNGATVDFEFINNKLRMTVTLPPVSPPAVLN